MHHRLGRNLVYFTFAFAALCGTFAGDALAQTAAAAPARRLPVELFVQNAEFMAPKLSPNGKFVAMLVSIKGGSVKLAVMDLATNVPSIVGNFDDADIDFFHWVNDDRLVYSSANREIGQGDTFSGPGLFAVNRDGTQFRRLVSREASGIRNHQSLVTELPWNTYFFSTVGDKTSDDVIVEHPNYDNKYDFESVDLRVLNTRTGRSVLVDRPALSRSWLVDRNGVPRITTSARGDIETVLYRRSASAPWEKLAEFDRFSGDAFTPEFFSPEGDLYVFKRGNRDKQALFIFDLDKKKIQPEPVVSLADYDFNGDFAYSKTRLLGVHYETDANATTWFDDEFKKYQKTVDAKLPGTVNNLYPALRAETPFVLVTTVSDTQPDIFFVFNTQTSALTLLGRSHTGIDAAKMAPKDLVHYKARDGMDMPAWLTLPKDGPKKNLPMVVMVHGGPYVRGGSWNWDAQVQFLASRGYAVLEPEFRGSTGFGWKHFRAGWKQWGLDMQNDVADGTRWAIAQQIADSKRVCIAGASYGGYATLMGLINDPELYRCGINWAGVTDINLMYSVNWSDASEESKKYGMSKLIGDPDKDAAQFKSTSPLLRANEIKQPLLLAYGVADARVPITHGTQFRNAVRRTNPNVEWVEYAEEGHGWYLVKNRIDFWTRVEKFLDRNIGKP